MNVSIGMMVRDFVSASPLTEFLVNASKYGHPIHSVVIAYSNTLSPAVVRELERYTQVNTVKINGHSTAMDTLPYLGMSPRNTETLLYCDTLSRSNLVPYGFNRNTVMMEAILTGSDVLIFVDSDVYPVVLMEGADGNRLEEIDFIGTHLKYLRCGAALTTSDYSGYNILPRARFEGMGELLAAVGKENMLPFWEASFDHNCLSFQSSGEPVARTTNKVLGGNLGIKLSECSSLPPFFSPYYEIDGTVYLGRGEDTMISLEASRNGLVCIDIDMHILHDTFGAFPLVPDLWGDPAVQQRFFYACTGWIGRNPFMSYITGENLNEIYNRQKEHLHRAVPAVVNYTGNEAYNLLPRAFDVSWASLESYIAQYQRTVEAWDEFIRRSELACVS